MGHTLLADAVSTEGAIRRSSRGLSWHEVESVSAAIGVTLNAFSELIGVPRSTFFRRQGQGRFVAHEAEHIIRYARLWSVALDVFGSEKAARSWLSRPQYGLDGNVPLEFAKTEFGARAVEELMLRIHHGILA